MLPLLLVLCVMSGSWDSILPVLSHVDHSFICPFDSPFRSICLNDSPSLRHHPLDLIPSSLPSVTIFDLHDKPKIFSILLKCLLKLCFSILVSTLLICYLITSSYFLSSAPHPSLIKHKLNNLN